MLVSSLMDNTASLLGSGADSSDPIAADAAKADKKFKALLASMLDAKDTLEKITRKGAAGYWAWKLEELRKQIAEKTMKDMNLTPEKIAAMSDAERAAVENKIVQIVEQQVRLAMQQEMQRRKQDTLSTSNCMQALIGAAQEIGVSLL